MFTFKLFNFLLVIAEVKSHSRFRHVLVLRLQQTILSELDHLDIWSWPCCAQGADASLVLIA